MRRAERSAATGELPASDEELAFAPVWQLSRWIQAELGVWRERPSLG